MVYICDAGLLKYAQKKCIGEFIGFGYQTESDFEKIEIIVTKFFSIWLTVQWLHIWWFAYDWSV